MRLDVEPELVGVELHGSIDVVDDVANAHGAHGAGLLDEGWIPTWPRTCSPVRSSTPVS